MINFIDIKDWHIRKFPQATYKSQLIHLAEEVREFNEALTEADEMEELADVIIVIISLRRFPETESLADDLIDFYYIKNKPDYCKELMKSIEKKIAIVDKRLYYWTGKDYSRKKIYGA